MLLTKTKKFWNKCNEHSKPTPVRASFSSVSNVKSASPHQTKTRHIADDGNFMPEFS